jgi:hypothetical protein
MNAFYVIVAVFIFAPPVRLPRVFDVVLQEVAPQYPGHYLYGYLRVLHQLHDSLHVDVDIVHVLHQVLVVDYVRSS